MGTLASLNSGSSNGRKTICSDHVSLITLRSSFSGEPAKVKSGVSLSGKAIMCAAGTHNTTTDPPAAALLSVTC